MENINKQKKLRILENKLRKMVREELLKESPKMGESGYQYGLPWRDFYNELIRLYNEHHDDLADVQLWITATNKFLKFLESEEWTLQKNPLTANSRKKTQIP